MRWSIRFWWQRNRPNKRRRKNGSPMPPTHPLEAFVGTYAADGYPNFAVRIGGEALQACTVGSLDWSELRHYHYNVFEWRLADFDRWVKVRFLVDDQGEVDAISIPIEPEIENVTFARKQPELAGEWVAQLVGEYDSPVEGIAFTVTAHNGRIYVAQTGRPPEEIKPYTAVLRMVEPPWRRAALTWSQ